MDAFKNLNDLFDCYDKDDLVAIDTVKQAIFYVRLGVQPEMVYPKEDNSGRMTYWFLKKKTQYVFRKWKETKPDGSVNRPIDHKPKYRKVRDIE